MPFTLCCRRKALFPSNWRRFSSTLASTSTQRSQKHWAILVNSIVPIGTISIASNNITFDTRRSWWPRRRRQHRQRQRRPNLIQQPICTMWANYLMWWRSHWEKMHRKIRKYCIWPPTYVVDCTASDWHRVKVPKIEQQWPWHWNRVGFFKRNFICQAIIYKVFWIQWEGMFWCSRESNQRQLITELTEFSVFNLQRRDAKR